MKSGMIVKQRDIVLIPFPYSDLSTSKKRPVLIISNERYNERNKDIICCAITSSDKYLNDGVQIDNLDLDEGSLKVKSTVKPGKIYSIHKERIIRKIGRLNVPKSKEVVSYLNKDIEIVE